MNGNWERIQSLFLEALELNPEERAPFLDTACAGDAELRLEVESLIAHDGTSEHRIVEALEGTAQSLFESQSVTIEAGTRIGDYEIQKLIGSGGMGEVYQARDVRLARDVAIKVLPPSLINDPDRLRRFEQEARAAAALNHPNIVAVYQMGVYEGAPHLVSELLEGNSLRELIKGGPLLPRNAIEYGVQIARGLAAAHGRGITHRDLKPENLFVTKDGHIKILDFGLAKLTDASNAGHQGPVTEAGLVMGTVGYMSPEQVRGQAVDYRTDFFAFGAILYEMLSGLRAFTKPTAADTMSAILNEDPPSISQLLRTSSPTLQRVVQRCLEKNREQRFQSASDLAFALEAASDPVISLATAIKGVPVAAATRDTTRSWRARKRALAAAAAVDPLRRVLVWSAATLVLVSVTALGYFLVPLRESGAMLRVAGFQQITHDGYSKGIVGTDGSRIYFTRGRGEPIGQVSVSGGPSVSIDTGLSNPQLVAVSPDGTNLLVSSLTEGNKAAFPIWVVPALGGSQRLLTDVAAESRAANWSPDGESVIYATPSGDINLIKSDGTGARRLISVGGSASEFSWTPDRRRIRFAKGGRLWEMSSDGTKLHELLPGWHTSTWQCCGNWTADGKFFLFTSDSQIWAIEEPRGLFERPSRHPFQLTTGPMLLSVPIPGKDGKKIFADGITQRGELIRFDAQSGQFRSFLGGISAEFVSISPDGKSVAYTSYPDGIMYRANRDGSQPAQLTYPPVYPTSLAWSPDSAQIAFMASSLSGRLEAYVVSAQAGPPHMLLPEDQGAEDDPSWSPDGRQIAFGTSAAPGKGDCPSCVVRILDLASHVVTTLPGSNGLFAPRWSPDGRSIEAQSIDSTRLSVFDIAAQRWKVIYQGSVAFPSWSHDGRFIYWLNYLNNLDVLRIPAAGGTPQVVTDVKTLHFTGTSGLWMGLDPEDAPMFLRDTGGDDIYALTLEAK